MSGIVGKSPFLNSNAVGKGLIGQVIQVVTDENNSSVETTSTSFQATNLAVTITPTSVSSKIQIHAALTSDTDANNRAIDFALFKGSSSLVARIWYAHGGESRIISGHTSLYEEVPAVTTAIIYSIRFKSVGGDRVYGSYSTTYGHITATEIGA